MTTAKRSVLVVGANGYIGLAVCRAFARAGWRVFGLVRRAEVASSLYAAEVTPIIGTLEDDSLPQRLYGYTTTLDAIPRCSALGAAIVWLQGLRRDRRGWDTELGPSYGAVADPSSGAAGLARNDVHEDLRARRRRRCRGAAADAERTSRDRVKGQCFNISASRYETARDVLAAMAREYEFPGGTVFTTTTTGAAGSEDNPALAAVFGFSQWVDSGKIRELTRWTEKRMLFSEDPRVYRMEYEAAVAADRGGTGKMRMRMEERCFQGRGFE
ncbi:NAD(P)-binding protein [Apiospora aurea]|uniref:NAD(P)-binding protein n=1 Tax=Apiospora aurea TaxID=335848 RepID=A0ABR1PY93_9PEZI